MKVTTSRNLVLLLAIVLGLLTASGASAVLQCSECSCYYPCSKPCADDLEDGIDHYQCSCTMVCAEMCYLVVTPDERFPDLIKVREPEEKAVCSATAEGGDTCLAFPALRN